RHADGRVSRPGLDRVVREAVRLDQVVGRLAHRAFVPRAGGEDAEVEAHQGDDVRLVQRAVDPDAVTEVRNRALAEAREPFRGPRVLPTAVRRGPPGGREVVVRHDGFDA